MSNYIIRQNTMNDKQYIQFEAVASGRYTVNSENYQKGRIAIFQAMQLADGEVMLWVDVGVHFVWDRLYHTNKLALLKRLPVERELSFDELYDLVIQYV